MEAKSTRSTLAPVLHLRGCTAKRGPALSRAKKRSRCPPASVSRSGMEIKFAPTGSAKNEASLVAIARGGQRRWGGGAVVLLAFLELPNRQ